MSKESIEIKKGIKVHYINTDLYKTNMACVILTTPLKEETATENALIPFMLKRGTENYQSQYILNKELEKLYGASFDCGIDKMGDNQIIKFYIDLIQNEYTLEKENILKTALNILFEIVFNPILENGKLKEEFLEVEKENLKNVIDSKIDEKDTFAFEECISNMYPNDGFGIYKFGNIENIEKITIDSITKRYNDLINNSKIDIYISGDFNKEEVKNEILENENIKKLKEREPDYIFNNEYTESKQNVENVKEIIKKMSVSQGKLVIGLDILSKVENVAIISMVYNAILGDGPTSFMFQNVREKESLAYSARSKYVRQKSNIFIRCGIQIENYEKAVRIIKEQIENIKLGLFTDENMDNAKSYLIAGLESAKEEQDTEIVFYIGQEICKSNMDIEEYIEKIKKVTREEVINLAENIQINTIFFLRD